MKLSRNQLLLILGVLIAIVVVGYFTKWRFGIKRSQYAPGEEAISDEEIEKLEAELEAELEKEGYEMYGDDDDDDEMGEGEEFVE
jgi:hypothetical protein